MDKTKIKNLIIKIASEEGVPPKIALAIAENESGFNPSAHRKNSDEDSIGLFQINRKAHPDYKAGTNIEANIRYGVRHFKGQLARAKGNVPVALAAYNGGWGGRNTSQAKGYAKRVMSIADKKYDKVAQNSAQSPTLYGEAIKAGSSTGAASKINMNIPDPERPNYTSLFKNTEVDPTGASRANLTQREIMALKNIAAPVQPIQDIRPDVIVGQTEDGKPITVTAAQYSEMLNQADTQKMLELNQNLQQRLPQLAGVETQLGGQNAYDTIKGLYGDLMNNDPRAQLVKLTPEQALDVKNRLDAAYNWGSLSQKISANDYYKMINALDNQAMGYDDAMALANSKYTQQQNLIKDAMTLAGNNATLASNLIKAVQAGNQDVINALQKTRQARMEKEYDLVKQRQADTGTLMNTQLQGTNTFLNQLPKTEAEAINNFNTFKNNRYVVDTNKYGKDVGAMTTLSLPEVTAEANFPIEQAKLNQNQQKINISQQNADTATAAAAGNVITNAQFNPQGFQAAVTTVPSLNNLLGRPDAQDAGRYFGLPQTDMSGSTPKTIDFLNFLRNSD